MRTLKGPLTLIEYQKLADVPSELEWFANIDNSKTQWAYKVDIEDVTGFMGTKNPEGMTKYELPVVRPPEKLPVTVSDEPKWDTLPQKKFYAGVLASDASYPTFRIKSPM